MEQISLLAVFAGITVAVILGSLAGMTLGLGFAADTARDMRERGQDISEPAGEEAFDRAFDEVSGKPDFVFQIMLVSVLSSVVSGAVTALLAPEAPYLNAAIVGAVGVVVGLAGVLVMPNFPRVIAIAGAFVTLPATLAGAWVLSLA